MPSTLGFLFPRRLSPGKVTAYPLSPSDSTTTSYAAFRFATVTSYSSNYYNTLHYYYCSVPLEVREIVVHKE